MTDRGLSGLPEDGWLDNLTGHDVWELIKPHDGIPGEWTYLVHVGRFFMRETRFGSVFWESVPEGKGIYNAVAGRHLLFGSEPKLSPPIPIISAVVDVYSGAYSAPSGILALPGADERFVGSHCVEVLHPLQDGAVYFQNSWSGWGDEQGCGVLSFDYLEKYFVEGVILRRGRLGPPARFVQAAPRQPKNFVRAWSRETEEDEIELGGLRGIKRSLSSLLYPNGPILQLVVLDGNQAVGWTHVRQTGSRDWLVEELFVLPEVRLNGIGSLLLDWIRGEMISVRCAKLTFVEAEADAKWAELNAAPIWPSLLRNAAWRPSAKRLWRRYATVA